MSRSIRLTLVAAAMSVGLTSSAHAVLLSYESFSGYPNANNDIVGQNGGTGFGGAWGSPSSDGFLHTVRTPTAIAYPGFNGATTPAASGGNFLNLAAAFGGSNPTAVFRSLDTSGGGSYGTNGYLTGGLIGADNTTLWASVLYSDEKVKAGNQSFATISLDGTTYDNTLVQTQTSNLVVYKFNFGAGATDTITSYANPNLATFDGTTGGVTSAPGNYAFNTLRITQTYANGPGDQGAETQFDDIRFGTTLADVAPAIPEPTSIAILGIATIGLLARRRRNA